MWILKFLPAWIFQAFILLGLVGIILSFFASFFARFIPTLHSVKLPIQILSVCFLVFGSYIWGGISNHKAWELKVKKLQEKVLVAEQKSKRVNTEIEYKYIDKVKLIKEVQFVVREKIKEVAVRIDAECNITPEAIDILNTAASNPKFEISK